jgi:hypothetical protein
MLLKAMIKTPVLAASKQFSCRMSGSRNRQMKGLVRTFPRLWRSLQGLTVIVCCSLRMRNRQKVGRRSHYFVHRVLINWLRGAISATDKTEHDGNALCMRHDTVVSSHV